MRCRILLFFFFQYCHPARNCYKNVLNPEMKRVDFSKPCQVLWKPWACILPNWVVGTGTETSTNMFVKGPAVLAATQDAVQTTRPRSRLAPRARSIGTDSLRPRVQVVSATQHGLQSVFSSFQCKAHLMWQAGQEMASGFYMRVHLASARLWVTTHTRLFGVLHPVFFLFHPRTSPQTPHLNFLYQRVSKLAHPKMASFQIWKAPRNLNTTPLFYLGPWASLKCPMSPQHCTFLVGLSPEPQRLMVPMQVIGIWV